ncbi:Na(+)-translocating NADH-quinone reductase subunit C [Desulfogranum mediterraneum]|uniref:Na(+)-translocating NADH-quinone reductase subunit C n=1 Tax=Desulfogranum mediterraneum TaxID=160661 RepID=UPI00041F753A|nr:Na(+)-translocating NADH-quinone reductase subunit C [Desulfogranum mediterraneum]
MAEESPLKPFYSVLVLAFVCSALVAGAAVGLRPFQEANRQLDQKKNILRAAGLLRPGVPVAEQFAQVDTRLVELSSGRLVPREVLAPEDYNQLKAAFSPDLGRPLERDEDLARLSRLEKYSLVYLVGGSQGLEQIILPVRGKGLWSTMFAYVALDGDGSTIRGISFYAHGETPGLGGEVENQRWQQSWQGKQVYGPEQRVRFRLVKGGAGTGPDQAPYEVDGLSGATMTSVGVNELMRFWFGEHGFQPFLERLHAKGGSNG